MKQLAVSEFVPTHISFFLFLLKHAWLVVDIYRKQQQQQLFPF